MQHVTQTGVARGWLEGARSCEQRGEKPGSPNDGSSSEGSGSGCYANGLEEGFQK